MLVDRLSAVVWLWTGQSIERFQSRVPTSYTNVLKLEKVFIEEKGSTLTQLVWNTNMAAVSLFWDTNMATVTSCMWKRFILKKKKPTFTSTYSCYQWWVKTQQADISYILLYQYFQVFFSQLHIKVASNCPASFMDGFNYIKFMYIHHWNQYYFLYSGTTEKGSILSTWKQAL